MWPHAADVLKVLCSATVRVAKDVRRKGDEGMTRDVPQRPTARYLGKYRLSGYGLLHGIGVRRSVVNARTLLRRAARSRDIFAYGRGEAQYLLAVSFLDAGRVKAAVPLLKRATADGDYPEAALALLQVKAGVTVVPCRCRRHLRTSLKGHARCEVHGRGT